MYDYLNTFRFDYQYLTKFLEIAMKKTIFISSA